MTSTFARGIHTYVLRAGRMTDMQRNAFERLAARYCVPFNPKSILDFPALFGRENPVVVEIGFGMGITTAMMAEADPETDVLGIEVHTPGVGKLLSEIDRRALTNVKIIHHDAVEVLETSLPPGRVHSFRIFFPDPWPKKRHHKRRLVQRPFTDLLTSRLLCGGSIHVVTDWSEYADFALEELSSTAGLKNSATTFADRDPARPMTKFEQRAIEDGRAIYELRFMRTD